MKNFDLEKKFKGFENDFTAASLDSIELAQVQVRLFLPQNSRNVSKQNKELIWQWRL